MQIVADHECLTVVTDQGAEPVDWDEPVAEFLLAVVEQQESDTPILRIA